MFSKIMNGTAITTEVLSIIDNISRNEGLSDDNATADHGIAHIGIFREQH